MFDTLDISASALTAQRVRLDTIAGNVANAHTTRDASGRVNPYRRRFAVLASGAANDPSRPGVHVKAVKQDPSPFRQVFDPGNADADTQGFVHYPNVDLAIEYVNALEASRAYEANITTMEVTKSMINATMRLLA